jgi:hypothetical protein
MRGCPATGSLSLLLCMIGLSLTLATQRSPAQSVNVTTWQQETPATNGIAVVSGPQSQANACQLKVGRAKLGFSALG